MSEFIDFVRAAGLIVDHIPADGQWHRVPTTSHPKKRNGSVKLFADGRVGLCEDHASGTGVLKWTAGADTQPAAIDFEAIERRRTAERQALIRATHAARKFYLGCSPLKGGHPYLEAHGLGMAGCHGLKIDGGGWLVVPVLLNGNLMSVQRISPEGEKKFWPGASVKAASYIIERRASITVLCEGLATGLAIFAAAPLTRVVVAFNAGNLSKVSIPHLGMAVVAADNDHETEERIGRNPGLKSAQEAADALGCGVAMPTGIAGTDWADYRQERIAAALAAPTKKREADIRRAVDAEIAAAMSRNARFLRHRVAA